MRLVYQREANTAMLELYGHDEPFASAATVPVAAPHGSGGMLLDFDEAGRLLTVAFLSAREQLSPEVLAEAQTEPWSGGAADRGA